MEFAFKLVALLAAFVAVTGGSIRRQASEDGFLDFISSDNSEECWEKKHDNCVAPNLDHFQTQIFDLQRASYFLQNRSNVVQWAAATQTAKACIEDEMSKPYCQGLSEEQVFDMEVDIYVGYLATPGNIDILVSLSNSGCFDDPDRILNIEHGSSTCLINLYMSEEDPDADLCQAVDDTRTCIINLSSSWCGTEAGNFIGSVWDYLVHSDAGRIIIEDTPIVPAYLVEGCYQQASTVKRFTRALMKRMYK
ncbi:hypothetical protein ElyMa_002563600 [Elysia marginata]|uniref:ADP-ribosyl cyclase/cyclic ADP-ribose hydrolase n=1 Tax=Elysia marginata TaxID=1093978 RepID=A0AAV4H080_9GAST|nr:hypothetical protein ElyMa_002563600 [Elysia marginata]